MSFRFFGKISRTWLSCSLALGLCSVALFSRAAEDDPATLKGTTAAPKGTNSTGVFHPLTPGPLDGEIANVTARMLQKYHYLRQPLNDAVSSKFLDRYLETLDPQRLHFLQSDLADFEI